MSSSYNSAGAYASADMGFPTGLPTDEAEDGLEFDLGRYRTSMRGPPSPASSTLHGRRHCEYSFVVAVCVTTDTVTHATNGRHGLPR